MCDALKSILQKNIYTTILFVLFKKELSFQNNKLNDYVNLNKKHDRKQHMQLNITQAKK